MSELAALAELVGFHLELGCFHLELRARIRAVQGEDKERVQAAITELRYFELLCFELRCFKLEAEIDTLVVLDREWVLAGLAERAGLAALRWFELLTELEAGVVARSMAKHERSMAASGSKVNPDISPDELRAALGTEGSAELGSFFDPLHDALNHLRKEFLDPLRTATTRLKNLGRLRRKLRDLRNLTIPPPRPRRGKRLTDLTLTDLTLTVLRAELARIRAVHGEGATIDEEQVRAARAAPPLRVV